MILRIFSCRRCRRHPPQISHFITVVPSALYFFFLSYDCSVAHRYAIFICSLKNLVRRLTIVHPFSRDWNMISKEQYIDPELHRQIIWTAKHSMKSHVGCIFFMVHHCVGDHCIEYFGMVNHCIDHVAEGQAEIIGGGREGK